MTLSDRERREAKGQTFQEDLLNNARTAWTKFGRKTQVGEVRISRNQPRFHRKGGGAQRSSIWGFHSIFFAYTL